MRLIDADKVNETIDRFIGYLDEDMILRIKMKMSKIPTVDRPRGEWQKKSFYSEYFYCSECGYAYKHAFNFCPNCGADMRKEGDEK